mgnify:FL=1
MVEMSKFEEQEDSEDEMLLMQDLEQDEDGNGLYEHFRFVVDKGLTLLRVD